MTTTALALLVAPLTVPAFAFGWVLRSVVNAFLHGWEGDWTKREEKQ